jgi:hypothetical protein
MVLGHRENLLTFMEKEVKLIKLNNSVSSVKKL